MAGMRNFEKIFRLQADSIQDIAGKFAVLAAEIGQGVKFGRRKAQPGPLLNAIVLRFLRLPEPERSRFAVDAIRELEVFLAETDEEREQAEQQQPEPAKPEAGQPPKLGNPRRTTERDKRADQEYRSGGKKGGKCSAGDSSDSKDKGTDREDLVPAGS